MRKVVFLSGSNSRNSGGLFNSVKSLAFGLIRNSDFNISIASYDDEYSKADAPTYKNIEQHVYNLFGPRQLGLSFNLKNILQNVKPDIIHQQGIWMFYSNNTKNHAKKYKKTKIIIAPRGMLDPWILKKSIIKKRLAEFLYESNNLKNADCLHALCVSEYDSIRNYGLKNPVAIIPNGIDLPNGYEKKIKKTSKKTLLFISRIHPKKGLDFLVEVLNNLNKHNKEVLEHWEIRIAGWSQLGHQNELEEKCEKYNLNNLITFVGPVYGDSKENELINADAFILPSYSEGLPMSVLEAWSYKLPVIMTKECNIPDGFSSNSAILIDHQIEKCSSVLKIFFNKSDEELQRIGVNGFNLVSEKYTWNKIALQTLELYEWLDNKKIKTPDFIKLN
jgi:glycosyltransferase involved in cell wall biosynthesis